MNTFSKRKRFASPRHGAVAVEAALLLPFLVALTLGAIDISQYVNSAQSVTNASREGARIASRFTTETTTEVNTVVMEYLSESFPLLTAEELQDATQIEIRDKNDTQITNGDLTSIPSGGEFSVRVDFDFSSIRWLQGPAYTNGNVTFSKTFCRRE